MEEIWKPITKIVLKNGTVCEFEGYDISNFGRVRTYKKKYGRGHRELNKNPYIINGRPDQKGYPQYCLSDVNKKRRNFRSHTLVMQTFVGIPKEYEIVCHNDDVKTNNHISNLRYDTQESNMHDWMRRKGIQNF
jgi:hypothetical protein